MNEGIDNLCQFTGRVVYVGKTEKFGKNPDKPFYKRQIIVDDADIGAKYPNEVPFEVSQDKCSELDPFKEGDVVTIKFFPNGRRWDNPKTNKTQWFGTFKIWEISLASEAGANDTFAEAEGDPLSDDSKADAAANGDDVDDMPF